MPLYQIRPEQSAVSVEGVEFKPNAEGLFALPAHGRIVPALQSHGLSVTKIADLPEEMDFRTQAEAMEEQKARIADLERQLAEARGETVEAAVVTPAPALSANAGGATSEIVTGRKGKAAGSGSTTQATGPGATPPVDTAPTGADGAPTQPAA